MKRRAPGRLLGFAFSVRGPASVNRCPMLLRPAWTATPSAFVLTASGRRRHSSTEAERRRPVSSRRPADLRTDRNRIGAAQFADPPSRRLWAGDGRRRPSRSAGRAGGLKDAARSGRRSPCFARSLRVRPNRLIAALLSLKAGVPLAAVTHSSNSNAWDQAAVDADHTPSDV